MKFFCVTLNTECGVWWVRQSYKVRVFFEEKISNVNEFDAFSQEIQWRRGNTDKFTFFYKNLRKIIEDIVNCSGQEIRHLSRKFFKVAGVGTAKLLREGRFVELQS